jgi:DNA polymerase-3 subunit delta
MKRQELDGLIRQNKAPNAVMLYGESHFLIDRYIRLLGNIENSNTLTLYHDEYDFTAAKAHLSQGSLFGDRNILIIKSEKKVLKNDLSALLELVKKKS